MYLKWERWNGRAPSKGNLKTGNNRIHSCYFSSPLPSRRDENLSRIKNREKMWAVVVSLIKHSIGGGGVDLFFRFLSASNLVRGWPKEIVIWRKKIKTNSILGVVLCFFAFFASFGRSKTVIWGHLIYILMILRIFWFWC